MSLQHIGWVDGLPGRLRLTGTPAKEEFMMPQRHCWLVEVLDGSPNIRLAQLFKLFVSQLKANHVE